jgi:hypothetical protein
LESESFSSQLHTHPDVTVALFGMLDFKQMAQYSFHIDNILALSMNIFELNFILPSSRSFVNATKSNNKKILKRDFVAKHRLLNHNIPRLTGRA